MDTKIRNEILRLIEKNCKIDIKELSKMFSLSEEEVLNELNYLEKENIICGYLALVDWDKTDIEKVTGLIEVKVTPVRGEGFDKLAERIYNYQEVSSVYLISGAYDLLITLEENSLKDIASFVSEKLSTLDTVISTSTHFILKKYKENGIIFGKSNKDEREALSL